MNSANINLEEIIKRKITYYKNDTDEELQCLNFGYIQAFEQMLKDINLSEDEFIKKYSKIQKTIGNAFELNVETAEKTVNVEVLEKNVSEAVEEYIDELSGYNNAIVDILSLLDYKYMFD